MLVDTYKYQIYILELRGEEIDLINAKYLRERLLEDGEQEGEINMAKDPAFVFYTGDFLNGVIDMTMEERGQYITLLCFQHQKGHISQKND